MNRTDALATLRGNGRVEVLVVGAGINGIGTFRDLAINGVDVVLVDKGDFCSGASAASSHMAHGGIRYLENGEFRLVREALRERNRMIRNAPHIVRPLPTTIPIFRRFSGLFNAPLKFLGLLDRPSERGSLVIKIGLMLYDAFTGRERTVPRHVFMRRDQSLRRWPQLNPSIVHTATYYDGAILQPERLGLELVLDAERSNSEVIALNYMRLEGREGSRVILKDEVSGDRFEVEPRIMVNATGPWIDVTNGGMGEDTHFIDGTKGSHIVLAHPELRKAIGDHEFFFENQDGRIVLIFPLYDRVLVGTSDIPIDNPDEARCSDEEVEYFLELVARVFPTLRPTKSDIVFRFSGVRPLAVSRSSTPGQMTRDHKIHVIGGYQQDLPFPIYSLVGGKWTSWRALSEETTDRCLRALGRTRRLTTRDMRIGGGSGFPTNDTERRSLLKEIGRRCATSTQRADELLERYGTRALEVADFIRQGMDESLKFVPDHSTRELMFIGASEKVVHLDDVLLRRTMLGMLGRLTRTALYEIAAALGRQLSWNAERMKDEIARALEILRNRHGVTL